MKDEEETYLYWFYWNADFGPAHSDVIAIMNSQYIKETGNSIPEGYDDSEY